MSIPKGWGVTKGVRDSETQSFVTEDHKLTVREVRTPVTKRDTRGVKMYKLLSKTKKSDKSKKRRTILFHRWRFEKSTS